MIRRIKLIFNNYMLKHKLRKKMLEISNAIPHRFREYFLKNCYLAGGCIRSLLANEKVKDWDIFFKETDNAMETFLADIGSCYGHPNMIIVHKSENAVSLILNKKLVQFIGKKFAGNPDYVISKFDFTNSMGYYDYYVDDLVITREMQESCSSKTLLFNEQAFTPILSPKRAKKFIDNGWEYDDRFNWEVFSSVTGYDKKSVKAIVKPSKKESADSAYK